MVSAPIIGSRGSALALWQANHINELLGGTSDIVVIKTQGDKIQHLSLDKVEGKGFFTKEIEDALIREEIDIAVHSFKDLPIEEPENLQIVGIPARAPTADVLVIQKGLVDKSMKWSLPKHARVGTSSLRRKAHLLSVRPDLELIDIRGNVPTRFGKVTAHELDAVVLAQAGLMRLGYFEEAHPCHKETRLELINTADVCPAPAQGALAIQIRKNDSRTFELISKLTHPSTALEVKTERELLSRFGGGCHLPLGALCRYQGESYTLQALVASPNGEIRIEAQASGINAMDVVAKVHASLVAQGANKYL